MPEIHIDPLPIDPIRDEWGATRNGHIKTLEDGHNDQEGRLDQLEAGEGTVASVNGMDGAVVLGAGDVGAAPTTHTHTQGQVDGLPAALSSLGTATTSLGTRVTNLENAPNPLPAGGATGQVLAKASTSDRDVTWIDQSGGGGGGAVDSVNGQTGVVILGPGEVGAAAASHTHTADQLSDSTAAGRALIRAVDAAAARAAIGAGTSNLAIGTTASTAKAGNYQPTWTDVTAKPSEFPPTPAGVRAVESWTPRAAGVRYKPVLGTIRKVNGTWGLITDAAHQSTGITSVSANSDRIRVNFDHTATKVGTLIAAADEAYSALGYTFGASVGTTYADIYVHRQATLIGGYVAYNGTAWTCLPSNVFRNFSYNGGVLTMEHDAIPEGTDFLAAVTGRGLTSIKFQLGSIGPTTTQVEFMTGAGVYLSSPSTGMRFFAIRGSQGPVPVDPLTMPETNANIWLHGANEI